MPAFSRRPPCVVVVVAATVVAAALVVVLGSLLNQEIHWRVTGLITMRADCSLSQDDCGKYFQDFYELVIYIYIYIYMIS